MNEQQPDLLQRFINGVIGAFIGFGIGMFVFMFSDGRWSGVFVPAMLVGLFLGAIGGDHGILGMLNFIRLFRIRRY
jgi:hypothetical protein